MNFNICFEHIHIFQLGTKYSDSMSANVIGEDGRAVNMNMGCYGIGVTRIIAASIEQNHDDRGIIFPKAIPIATIEVFINILATEADVCPLSPSIKARL